MAQLELSSNAAEVKVASLIFYFLTQSMALDTIDITGTRDEH